MDRREFLKMTAVAAGAAAVQGTEQLSRAAQGELIYRTLGKTGEKVSPIGIGGSHIGGPKDEAEAIRIMRAAIDRGVTFMDNCWDYREGVCEARMGKALRDGYREKVFLMTKIDRRTSASTTRQIDESLQRLQTDHVDLMQIHEVIRLEDRTGALRPRAP